MLDLYIMKLSIIILNYKSQGHLRQSLRYLHNAHFNFEVEVIVVDNGSHDQSQEITTLEYPSALYLGQPVNCGYSTGNNIGMRRASGDFILLLNPDTSLFPGAIEKLLSYLSEHPQVGVAAPKLINPDGSTQLSGALFPSFIIPLWRRSWLGNMPRPRQELRTFFISGWDRNSSRPVGWALGACFMIRRAALKEVGYFDERFFLYFEDVDYCRRMWENKWEVHYVADAEMIHYLSRTSAVNPGLSGVLSYATRIHIRSWLKYTFKYLGKKKPLLSM